jgi:outer membrane biosynthesis protein TonB
MEHFELVEKLVNTFGVSYEKAKEALEASNWDAIDAAIYLEREKRGEPQPVQQEIPEEPKQESVQEEQPKVNTEPKGSYTDKAKSAVDDLKEEGGKFFKTIWDFLSLNSFVVKKSTGEVFLDIPIWLMTLLLCAFFWAVIFILAIVFVMGYRFSFKGPQLGKKNVENTVSHVESVTEEFVDKVKNTVAPDNLEPVQNEEVKEEIIIEPNPEQNVNEQPETNEQKEGNETLIDKDSDNTTNS